MISKWLSYEQKGIGSPSEGDVLRSTILAECVHNAYFKPFANDRENDLMRGGHL